jgi:phage-related protein
VSVCEIYNIHLNSLFIQQEATSVAESGDYVDKLTIFEATAADRTLYVKGDEVIIYHPTNKKKQQLYKPKAEMKLTVPAGYAVCVVKA